ncbi:hypothetical protein [Teredinibacter sp. KSP-S5-2]|uniref:hypothetical protein n=1 Tax=Teredinibacter sp. KSP-S5-2 TaxID=3034506 RepID=UPI002934DBF7|nr:hypothetical protein [Teredinibacter sp. KSP-S5-2]WNO11336.1 hypothetical protein P5V12_09145 [Teredinibacter sp. KSP-S5-2]
MDNRRIRTSKSLIRANGIKKNQTAYEHSKFERELIEQKEQLKESTNELRDVVAKQNRALKNQQIIDPILLCAMTNDINIAEQKIAHTQSHINNISMLKSKKLAELTQLHIKQKLYDKHLNKLSFEHEKERDKKELHDRIQERKPILEKFL